MSYFSSLQVILALGIEEAVFTEMCDLGSRVGVGVACSGGAGAVVDSEKA